MRASAMALLGGITCVLTAQAAGFPETLKDLAARGAAEGWTFEVGDTPMRHGSLPQVTGGKMPPDWRARARFTAPAPVRNLPARFDWRDKGVVGPIRDQASPRYCGSCWAHATIAAYESAIAIKTGHLPTLAPQQLVSCQPSYGTCDGGGFAFDFYKTLGANHEEDFPYQASDIPCKTDAPQHEKGNESGFLGAPNREPTLDEIKQAIYAYGPVMVNVAVSASWASYKGGIYNACDSWDLNHLVTLVGWDDTEQVWLVRNSHGSQWGENGYMRSVYLDKQGRKCNGLGNTAAWVRYTP